jgi:enamine deaminase RidA (YjgF/YER057c/UK114 family)
MAELERRLRDLGHEVPPPPRAIGNYAPGVLHGDVLYLSGTYGTAQDSEGADALPMPGKLGAELDVAQGYESARMMVLNHLALARQVVGDLDRLIRPLRLVGYVNAAPGFQEAPQVLDGASDLLVGLFGPELGAHARMALYQPELTRNAPVAGEITFAVRL